jgi:hypothetical protein
MRAEPAPRRASRPRAPGFRHIALRKKVVVPAEATADYLKQRRVYLNV